MKKTVLTLILTSALLVPSLAQAKNVTFNTKLGEFSGKGAYAAMYLTDADGKFVQTLWLAGTKTRYYRALRGWAQASGMKSSEYDGKTGATIPSGGAYSVTIDLDDAVFDAGYKVHIDVVAEGNRPSRNDINTALTTQDAGKMIQGSTYVQSFEYRF